LPAFKVLGNQEILELVRWAASYPRVPLYRGPRLPRNIVGAQLTTLEEGIARVAAMDESEWPELGKRDHDSPPKDCTAEINVLRPECAQVGQQFPIAASTLAPRVALEAIVRSRPRTIDEIMKSSGLLRWQAELVQSAVEKCLH